MAVAAGKQQPQQQPSPTRTLDDLGDMAWLGSLVEPGVERPPVPASPPQTRVSSGPAASLQPVTASSPAAPPPPPPLDQSAQSALDQRVDPSLQASSSGASYPTSVQPDVWRRTSSGPPATTDYVGTGGVPRGPNAMVSSSPPQPIKPTEQRAYQFQQQQQQQQQQQPALSPSSLSPSDSRPGGFFSAFRRTSSSQLSPTATSFGSGGGDGRLSPTAGTGSYVPVIKDEHALHRRQSLAKQLLGPSSSNGQTLRRTSASHEQMSVTREEDAIDDYDAHEQRRRHITADGPVGGRHGYSDSTGSRSTTASSTYGQPVSQHQQAYRPSQYASVPRQRVVSSSPSIPEYASEPGWGPLVGGRVVRIDGRLFRFDRSGDRLDLILASAPTADGTIESRPTSTASSVPTGQSRREASPRRLEVSQPTSEPGGSQAIPLAHSAAAGLSPTPSAGSSTGGGEAFYGDAINHRYSALSVASPLRQDFARPAEIAVAAAPEGGASQPPSSGRPLSQAPPIESPLTAVSESLSLAEVELVQNAVYGHAGEQGHVVQLRSAAPVVAAADRSAAPSRPSFETKDSELSSRTVVPSPSGQTPIDPQSISQARPTGLPFEGRVESPHRGHPAVGIHSARTSASSSQRPVVAPLVIPSSSTSTSTDLKPREQAAARLTSGAPRQQDRSDADEGDDDRPLAHRLVKLQQRDSSPAVLRSPVLGGPSTGEANDSERQQHPARPPLAVDQPPPLPAKSQSFSIPASRPYQQQQQYSPSHLTAGGPHGSSRPPQSQPSAESAPRDPYEVLSRPMPKELDTSAQMKEKLMRSMTGFGKARKSAKSKMEQVVDAARNQLAAGSPLTAPHLGVPKSTSTPSHHHHPSGASHANPYANPHAQPHAHSHSRSMATGSNAGTGGGGGSTLTGGSVAPSSSASSAADDPSTAVASRSAQPLPPPPLMAAPARHEVPLVPAPVRPASPKREALSPLVHTSDSLARRMAEVEDEEERRLAENVFM